VSYAEVNEMKRSRYRKVHPQLKQRFTATSISRNGIVLFSNWTHSKILQSYCLRPGRRTAVAEYHRLSGWMLTCAERQLNTKKNCGLLCKEFESLETLGWPKTLSHFLYAW